MEFNGTRAKPGKPVKVGDRLRVRKGPFDFVLEVVGLADRRVSARAASPLYQEDPIAREARERLARQLRLAPAPRYEGKGRPTKKERREIERLSSGIETENRQPRTDDPS